MVRTVRRRRRRRQRIGLRGCDPSQGLRRFSAEGGMRGAGRGAGRRGELVGRGEDGTCGAGRRGWRLNAGSDGGCAGLGRLI